MKYALPCSDTLIKRGEVDENYIKKLFEIVKSGKDIPKNSEKIFKVAYSFCKKIGEKINKDPMDEDVIRRYFLYEHDDVVEKIGYEQSCKVYPGLCLKIENGLAKIITPIGVNFYKMDFLPDLKENEYVVVHREFVVERVSKDLAKKLWDIKALQSSLLI